MGNQILVLILLVIIVICFIIYKKRYENESLIISESKINGKGVFARKRINEGDVIIANIFNGKNPISLGNQMFKIDKYMSMFNHCSKLDNATIIKVGDYYDLVAIKPIMTGDEITANYNKVNKEFNFIKYADIEFVEC